MNWATVVEKVSPAVVKIETRYGQGTGFLLSLPEDFEFHAIVTARHVIEHAAKWDESILIHFSQEEKPYLYREKDRTILFNPRKQDHAVLLVGKRSLELLRSPVELLPFNISLNVGEEVGWLGFPAGLELCFFSGKISRGAGAFGIHEEVYLIDGVAISGVSGGPVIFKNEKDKIYVAGLISAYFPNRATGEPLPGLSIAQTSKVLYEKMEMAKELLQVA